jgi:hypothetical protein
MWDKTADSAGREQFRKMRISKTFEAETARR